MLTACPKCNLMLVVTAADLRAAQGHVRCGRCRSVFNALESLAESPTDPLTDPLTEPTPPRASEAKAPDASEVILPHLADALGPQMEDQTSELAVPSAEDQLLHEEAVEGTARETADETIEADAIVLEEPPSDQAPVSALSPRPSRLEAPSEAASPELEPPAEFALETAEARHTGAWLAGALVLALLLAGQAVNHYRGSLATLPSIGPPLRAFYGALGIPVSPLWNVRAYDARQLGATVSASHPHQITVRASIANMGRWPLPLPLLRITLQDRYGRTIAARDVAPRDYVPASSDPAAMLAAGQRVDATVTFVSPGPQAIGFEIDTCLREAGSMVCTHGP